MNYHLHLGRTDEAKALVLEHHYSKRWPGAVTHVFTLHEDGGLFGDYGKAVGACLFGQPANPGWHVVPIELQRLVRLPGAVFPLSKFVSDACTILKREKVPLLISYADIERDHHGGIYQACSWNYNGKSRPTSFINIHGQRKHKRTISGNYGTCSVGELKKILGEDAVTRGHDSSKYLYWRALTKEGKKHAEANHLKSLPYPKPDLNK